MALLEKDDIQGLIARGFGKLASANYVLLKITDAAAVKKYLSVLLPYVNTVGKKPGDFAIQVAFTSPGLKKLGLPPAAWHSFSREFLEGMNDSFRAVILGDENENAQEKWEWGGPKNEEIDLMLMYFAKDDDSLHEWYNAKANDYKANGLHRIKVQETTEKLPDSKEHFGFRDGISKPKIEGFREVKPGENDVKPGEFILGYPNEYNLLGERPVVVAADDPNNILPPCTDSENAGHKDLGKNGSYLVYRQMKQHVYTFWKYLADNSKEPAATPIEAAVKLASKMVGRWPDGTPLALSPAKEDHHVSKTDFMYSKDDPDGLKCPFGSHLRRANPRDMLFGRTNEASKEMIRKHFLLRRGRSYGPACVDSMDPAHVLAKGDDGEDRGLHFICLVGDLSRQFEFVQNVWIKNPTFSALYNDADPIIATRSAAGQEPNNHFTVQDGFRQAADGGLTCPVSPVRRKYKDIPPFTTVVGGAYFFLPGIKALKYITNC